MQKLLGGQPQRSTPLRVSGTRGNKSNDQATAASAAAFEMRLAGKQPSTHRSDSPGVTPPASDAVGSRRAPSPDEIVSVKPSQVAQRKTLLGFPQAKQSGGAALRNRDGGSSNGGNGSHHGGGPPSKSGTGAGGDKSAFSQFQEELQRRLHKKQSTAEDKIGANVQADKEIESTHSRVHDVRAFPFKDSDSRHAWKRS